MIRQYYAQRRQGGDNPKGVGVIAVGSIYYLQPDSYFKERFRGSPSFRDPWIVQAFLNGTAGPRRCPHTGIVDLPYISRRSDRALVQSLRTGAARAVSVHTLILHDDLGLTKGATEYPTLPQLRQPERPLSLHRAA